MNTHPVHQSPYQAYTTPQYPSYHQPYVQQTNYQQQQQQYEQQQHHHYQHEQQQQQQQHYHQPPLQAPAPENFLSNAFPNVDRATIRAILASTKGEIDPAYDALLAISGSGSNTRPPALPPRPNAVPEHPPATSYSPIYPPSPHALQPQQHPPPPAYIPSQNDTYNTPQQQGYLSPTHFTSSHQSIPNSTITPTFSSTSPNLHPQDNAPPQYHPNPSASPAMPDIGSLSLGASGLRQQRLPEHWARCDGCGADPIKGDRWKCLACSDYDLCDDCRVDKIHDHHRFESIRAGIENHFSVYCDGCTSAKGILQGTRHMCLKHNNEDWCTKCVSSGKACGGPYKEIKQTKLGLQIEQDGFIPMPQSWIPLLMPPVASYTAEHDPTPQSWIDDTLGIAWFDQSVKRGANQSGSPVYKTEMKWSKGHFRSDNKYSWTMKRTSDNTSLYSYLAESDRKTNDIKSQQFSAYKGDTTSPIWEHGAQNDTLHFQDPKTNIQYRWESNRPISSLNGERYDFQRNALFTHQNGTDRIVADWTWWNASEPDTDFCLTIRDPQLDHAMVMASLTILWDHQWLVLQDEKKRDPTGIAEAEETARLTKRGYMVYWNPSDVGAGGSATVGKNKLTTAQALKLTNNSLELANNIVTVAAASSGGGGGGGGGGC